MRTVTAITTYEEFLTLEPVWNRLLAESDSDMIFMTFEWFKHWWQMFGSGMEMIILVMRNAGNDIVAIVPLILKTARLRGIPVQTVSYMANYHSPRAGLILRDAGSQIIPSVVEFLQSRHYRYDMLCLDMMEKGSWADRQIQNYLNAENIPYRRMEGERSPYLKLAGTWEEYVKSRKKNIRKCINHCLRTTEDAAYRVDHYPGSSLATIIEDVITVSKHTWKYREGTGMAGTPALVSYYHSLMQMLADNGWLRITVLKHQDVPIAFSFNSIYHNRMYGHQIGYDLAYQNLSPGRVVSTIVLKNAFDAGNNEYDFLGKDEPYKMEYTDTCREHSKYFIFNDTATGACMNVIENALIPGIKNLISRPMQHITDSLRSRRRPKEAACPAR